MTATPPLFSPDALTRQLEQLLPAATAEDWHVVVGTVDEAGARIAASFRRRPNRRANDAGAVWELQAVAHHEWAGDSGAGARVILKWP